MDADRRKRLRSANVVARGWILVAKQAETREEMSRALCKALLQYAVWTADGVSSEY